MDREPPSLGVIHGHPILDLQHIPRERWEAELAPLHREARYQSLRAVGLSPTHPDVAMLWLELELADLARLQRMREAMHDPPSATPGGRWRQVSLRLTTAEYLELCGVAAELKVKPSTVVRMLVRNGIARMVYEARRPTAS